MEITAIPFPFLIALFLLGLVGLALWVWLLVRIGKVSIAGAVLTFFFWPASLYFLIKYWNDEELNVRAPFFSNIAIMLVPFLVFLPMAKSMSSSMKARSREQVTSSRSNPAMERWCRDKNDAVYQPDLGTCVERAAAQPVPESAPSADGDVFTRLERHFRKNGLAVDLVDLDKEIAGIRANPLFGILLPQAAPQPQSRRFRMLEFQDDDASSLELEIGIIECPSALECAKLQDETQSIGPGEPQDAVATANGTLALMTPADAKHPLIPKIRDAFRRFQVR